MDTHTVEPELGLGGGHLGPLRGGRAAEQRSGWLTWAQAHPLGCWWGISLALAVLTAIVWPTVPSYDPWSWIDWGREVTDPHMSFFVGNGPSWKPLPFVFTVIYSLFGNASPTLWVITARTGGIAGLIGAARLAALLCRRAGLPVWTLPVAGLFAAAGIVLTAPTSGWAYYFFRGTSEPLLIGVWLWSIDRLIAGRHWQAFMLMAAEGLMRPEAWPFLLVYGAWLIWRQPSMRAWVVLGWIAQPVGWFVPPWISTGQPFMAAIHASDYNGDLGSNPFATVVSRGEGLQPLPSLVLAIIAVALAVWLGRASLPLPRAAPRRFSDALARFALRRDSEVPLVLGLALATIAWWVIVVAMTEDGYPGLERFFLPAAAMTCVLAGYGLVRLATWLGAVSAGRTPVALGVVAVVLAGSTHYVSARWQYARAQEPLAATAVVRIDDLGRAINVLGGRARMLPCSSSVVTINHALQTALAWKLETTLARIPTVLKRPGLAFVGPHDSIDGGLEPPRFQYRRRVLARVGAWRVEQIWRRGTRRPACVGS